MLDITPKQDHPEERILFLADPSRPYKGRQRDNVRMPLTDNKLLHDFIALRERRFRFMNRGARAGVSGNVSIQGHEVAEFENIDRTLAMVLHMFVSGMSAEDRCLCNSGRRYSRCCGKKL
jgi:hypothetical protein